MAKTTVNSQDIRDLNVNTIDIAAAAVTLAKLGALTNKGDLLTSTGASVHVAFPVGVTNGMVLSVNSAQATGLEWVVPGTGSGTVTSVGSGTGITNSPATITGAGTVNLDLNSLTTGVAFASGDLLGFVDVSVGTTPASQRKLTVGDLQTFLGGAFQPLDADLTAIAALSGTGYLAHTGVGTWAERTFAAPAAGLTISNPGGVAGNSTFALANDLLALEGLSTTGFGARTATDTWALRTLTAPAAGFTITNPAGVAGDPTFVLANDLAALEGLGATGIAVRTATDTWAQRTLQAPAAGFTITNPAGVAGDPTFVLANDLAALEGLGSTGFAARTATDTWAQRSITVNGLLSITNPAGIAGNPLIDWPDDPITIAGTSIPSKFTVPIGNTAVQDSSVTLTRAGSAANFGPVIHYGRARGDIGSEATVANADLLGRIQWNGFESTTPSYRQAARIEAVVDDATPSATSMGAKLSFYTVPATSLISALRLEINNAGRVTMPVGLRIGDTAVSTQALEIFGHVLIDNTDNVARELRLREPSTSGTDYSSFKAQAQAATLNYTLPAAILAGGVLTTDVAGVLTWAAAGGTGTVTSVGSGTGITNSPASITTTGTVNLDINTLTAMGATIDTLDLFAIVDVSVGATVAAQRKATLGDIATGLNALASPLWVAIAGRAGTANNFTLSTTGGTGGTITGAGAAATAGSPLTLIPSNTTTPGQLIINPTGTTLPAGTAVGGIAIPLVGLTFGATSSFTALAPGFGSTWTVGANSSGANSAILGWFNTIVQSDALTGATARTGGLYRGLVWEPTFRINDVSGTPTFTIDESTAVRHTLALLRVGTVGTLTLTTMTDVNSRPQVNTGTAITTRRGFFYREATVVPGNVGTSIAFDVEDTNAATTNITLQSTMSAAGGGGGKRNLLFSGSAVSVMVGGLRIGDTTAPTQKLEVLGHVLLDNAGTASELRLREPSASGANYTAFKAQAQAADLTYTLPAAIVAGGVLTTDVAGVLTWAAAGGTGTVTSVNSGTGITNSPSSITTTGSVNLDINTLTAIGAVIDTADLFAIVDVSVGATVAGQRKVTLSDIGIGLNALTDPFSQYVRILGRTTTGNDFLVSQTGAAGGTITGSSVSAAPLRLFANSTASSGQVIVNPTATGLPTSSGVGGIAIPLSGVSFGGATLFSALTVGQGLTWLATVDGISPAGVNVAWFNTIIQSAPVNNSRTFGRASGLIFEPTFRLDATGAQAFTIDESNALRHAPVLIRASTTGSVQVSEMTDVFSRPTLNTGTTITTRRGLYYQEALTTPAGVGTSVAVDILDTNATTTNIAMRSLIAATGGGGIKRNLLFSGDAVSVMVGGLRIGDTTAPTQKLEVVGHVLITNTGTASELRLAEPGGVDYSSFKAQAQAGNLNYTLPAAISASAIGTSIGALSTTSAGALTWVAYQPSDAGLTALAGLNPAGFAATDGADNWFPRTLTSISGEGIEISAGDGSGNPFFALGINEMSASLTGATIAGIDTFPVFDDSALINKKISFANFASGLQTLDLLTGYTKLAGRTTTTNDTLLSTSGAQGGTLTGSSVAGAPLNLATNATGKINLANITQLRTGLTTIGAASEAAIWMSQNITLTNTASILQILLFNATLTYNAGTASTQASALFDVQPAITNSGAGSAAMPGLKSLSHAPSYIATLANSIVTDIGVLAAPTFTFTGAGTYTNTTHASLQSSPTIDTGMTMGTRRGYFHQAHGGTGTITNDVAIDIQTLLAGTLNISLRSAGANVMRHAGSARFGSSTASALGSSILHVDGGLTVKRTAATDAAYTVLLTDYIIEFPAITAGRTATLPTVANAAVGKVYIFKKTTGAFAMTVAGNGAETVDGAASVATTTATYQVIRVYCTGAAWMTW